MPSFSDLLLNFLSSVLSPPPPADEGDSGFGYEDPSKSKGRGPQTVPD
jgi:hypothetical protein